MPDLLRLSPVDYLLIGHVSTDLTPRGPALGGTATYAGLTAHALGLQVGLVTSAAPDLDLAPLSGLTVHRLDAAESTGFENLVTPDGREQILHARAADLSPEAIPPAWQAPRIVHLAPIADEVSPDLAHRFPGALLGLTPQGWLRSWDSSGRVSLKAWDDRGVHVQGAAAVVLSLEDLQGDEAAIEDLVQIHRLLVVTDAANGARVYWNRDARRVPAPRVDEVDSTGAGDIFAAAFFIRLFHTRDPWEAARFANALAAASVTRSGVASIPTAEEVDAASLQVLP